MYIPDRSPWINLCIFGFHRLVWCPKWTPASSNCFILTTAMSCFLSHRLFLPRFGACRRPWVNRVNIFVTKRLSGLCECIGMKVRPDTECGSFRALLGCIWRLNLFLLDQGSLWMTACRYGLHWWSGKYPIRTGSCFLFPLRMAHVPQILMVHDMKCKKLSKLSVLELKIDPNLLEHQVLKLHIQQQEAKKKRKIKPKLKSVIALDYRRYWSIWVLIQIVLTVAARVTLFLSFLQ